MTTTDASPTGAIPSAIHFGADDLPFVDIGDGSKLKVIQVDAAQELWIVENVFQAGYVVHNASDGSEAMAMIGDAARNFDLVLSDVMMPGHTGPEIADRLAVLRPQTPVLLMTGYAEEQLAALLDTSVKREIITKPFSAEALTSRVATLLRTLSTSGQHAG